MSLDAPALFTHDLNQLIVVIRRRSDGSDFEVDGKMGDGIQINLNAPKYTDLEVSKDAKIAVRNATNDRSGKILTTAVQYSPVHTQYAGLYVANPQDDLLDITISDLSNRLLYQALGCYLSLFANAQYADEKGNRTHEITCPFIEMDKPLV